MMPLSLNAVSIHINNKIICENLNLQIAPGMIWGVLGPNGSGKTTLLHSLAGLLPLASGKILLDEQPLSLLPRKLIAQYIGILLQDFNPLFPQTIWDYCLAGRYPHLNYLKKESQVDKEITLAALQAMQLEHAKERVITQLSGGEKRRLAIASLLTQNPAIYLLDEPTNHLDISQQILVLNHFQQLVRNKPVSVIMALHDINLAHQFCDSILMLLPNGKVLHGATENMLTSNLLSELYQHPMDKITYENNTFFTIRTSNAN